MKALEPSHMAVIIVTGRSVADWLLYMPEITAEKKLWKESGIKTSNVFKNIVSVKGVNLRTANINIKNGKKESIRKKADCPEKAGIAALFVSFIIVSVIVRVLLYQRIKRLYFI